MQIKINTDISSDHSKYNNVKKLNSYKVYVVCLHLGLPNNVTGNTGKIRELQRLFIN